MRAARRVPAGTLPGRLAAAAVLAWLAFAPFPVPVSAGEPAEPAPAAEEPEDFGVYLDTEDDAERLIRLAARAAEEGRWRPCLEAYLECMRSYGGKVMRGGADDAELYVGVGEVVRAMMARAPKEGRELWTLLKRGEFSSALARAGSDPDELAAVERGFSGLPFAADALVREAEARYALGDVAGAVRTWLLLVRSYQNPDLPRAKLLARAALAAAGSGLEPETAAALDALRAEAALASVTAGGAEFRVVDEVRKRLAAARAGAGSRPAGEPAAAIGGMASAPRAVGPLVAPTMRRWQRELPVPSAWSLAATHNPFAIAGQKPDKKKPEAWPFPAYHATILDGVLLLSGDMGAMALREHDGERLWALPEDGGGLGVAGTWAAPAIAGGRLVARQGRINVGSARFGAMGGETPDSRLLVLEPGTGREMVAGGVQPPPAVVAEGREPRPGREQGQGGGEGPGEQDVFQGKGAVGSERMIFVGAPSAGQANVYCGMIRSATQAEYELAAFDLDGRGPLWRSFLCGSAPLRLARDTWGMQGGALLAEVGQSPVTAGGTVCVVTNLGAVAALESATGRTMWLRLYPRFSPKLPAVQDPFRGGVQAKDWETRAEVDMWDAGVPCVDGGVLFAAPQDCDHLLAIDVATGRLVWRAARCGLRRLVGVRDGKVFLSGRNELVARDAGTGRALWRVKLGGDVVGLGALGDGYLAVSTTVALEAVDLSGKPLFQYKWSEARSEAGNVLVRDGSVYTLSATHANAFCNMDAVTKRLAEDNKRHPEDAAPLFEMAALQCNAGRYGEATAVLEKASALVRPGERYAGQELATAIRAKLWLCHWSLAEAAGKAGDHEAALQSLERALGCAVSPEDVARALLARAGAFRKLGRRAEALAAYHRLMAEVPEARCDRDDGSMLRAWLLAIGEVKALVAEGGGIEEPYEKAASALRGEAGREGSLEKAERVARLYPNSRAANESLIFAAEAAAKSGQAEAELRCLRTAVLLQGDGPEGGALRARLALAYARHGYLRAARTVAGELLARGGKLTLGGAETTCEEFLAAHPELGRAPLPELAPPLKEKWRVKLAGAALLPGCEEDAQLVLMGLEWVRAIDVASGKMLWEFDLKSVIPPGGFNVAARYGTPSSEVDGDAVILRLGGAIAVLDRSSGRLRWKGETADGLNQLQQYYYRQQGLFRGEGMQSNYSLTDGVLAVQESVSRTDQLGRGEVSARLRALSMDDGKLLWSLVLGKGEETRAGYIPGYGHAAGGWGTARSREGALVTWRSRVEQTAGRPGATAKASLMAVDACAGLISRRGELGNVVPMGLACDRLICSEPGQRGDGGKLVAFGVDGRKAWEISGAWQLRAVSSEDSRLVLGGAPSYNRNTGQQEAGKAAVADAHSGKLIWNSDKREAGSLPGQTMIVRDRFLSLAVPQGHNWSQPYNSVRRGELECADLSDGRMLWRVPFLPSGLSGSRVAGRGHLAMVSQRMAYLDADGKPIEAKPGEAFGMRPQPVQPAAVRRDTVVWLFDMSGGKAVQEWMDPEPPVGKMNGQVFIGGGRVFSGGSGDAVRDGLLITTSEAAVLLAPEDPGRSGG